VKFGKNKNLASPKIFDHLRLCFHVQWARLIHWSNNKITNLQKF